MSADDDSKEQLGDQQEEARLYAETRQQLTEVVRQLYGVQQQIVVNQRRVRRNQLTLSEISKVDDAVATFKPVGRMFIRQPCSSIQGELAEEDKQLELEIQSLQAKQTYLVKEKEAAEKQLDELAERLQTAELDQN